MTRRKLLVFCIILACLAMVVPIDASVLGDHEDCVALCDADRAECVADAQDQRAMCYDDAEVWYGWCMDAAGWERDECLKSAQPGIPATECQNAYSDNSQTCADERAALRSDCNATYSSDYFACQTNRTTCVGTCP